MKKNASQKKLLTSILAETANAKIEKIEKNRAYKKQDHLPIPQGIDKLSIKEAKHSNRKLKTSTISLERNRHISVEQMHCSHNQNYPLFFIEKAENLQKKTIINLKVKEHLIALRNIKICSHQMQQWIRHEIKLLGEPPKEFFELLQRREERHFQIDRIIRYLSNTWCISTITRFY